MNTEFTIAAIREAIDKIDYANSVFVYINLCDLREIDLNEVDKRIYFIATGFVERGQYYVIYKDSDIKQMLYKTAKKFPNRMKRGKKECMYE